MRRARPRRLIDGRPRQLQARAPRRLPKSPVGKLLRRKLVTGDYAPDSAADGQVIPA